MARTRKYQSHKYYRNSRSNLESAANIAIHATARTTEGVFRYITTDRSGMGRAISHMPPSMGFLDSAAYIASYFLIAVAGAVLTGILYFILIAFGIPFLITGSFPSMFAP